MKKKKYSKPRVTQVRLVVQNPVLGECFSVDTAVLNGFCNVPDGCPYP
jgi:hypothetical protein